MMVMYEQLFEGMRLSGRSIGLVWRHKSFLWYGLFHIFAHYGVCGVTLLCGLPLYEMVRMCYWFYFPGVCVSRAYGFFALGLFLILLFAWAIAVVYAIMLSHIRAAESKTRFALLTSVLDGRLLLRLLGLSAIHVAVLSLLTALVSIVGQAVSVGVFVCWYIGASLALPVLVYQRLGIRASFVQSFALAWHWLVMMVSALVTTVVLVLGSLTLVRMLSWLITLGVCFALSVPVCMHLLVPFLLFYIPILAVVWYAMTVVMVLPALIALRATR